ncbi:ribokinase [Staphylotrichum tortipilum]|uniref:Ribokinase n=1 Tax=Staphylotrichum tortipilum TaxID=2831512 RepID=A0AAN6MDG5_9PEZI|nr:ribokinase [Staphylotrichum longicolle]
MASIPHITVLGSLNMDLVAYVPHHPLPGETLTATSSATSPGGKGANQAVAIAKLSRSAPSSPSALPADETASVSMIGTIGRDAHGTALRSNLSSYGVQADQLRVSDKSQTGVALIIVDEPTGENRIVLAPGANHDLLPDDVPAALGWGEKKPDLLVMQLEIPLPSVFAALEAAKQAGVEVLLNPAPARPLPEAAYAGLGHLVVNETEAALLGGVEVSELDTEEGMEKVARGFVGRGVRNVVITLGGRGVYYMGEGGEKGLVGAEKAKVVDTTAAGDTFVGRYALDVVRGGVGIGEAVRRANKAAARTVERKGAQDSIPWRDEVE